MNRSTRFFFFICIVLFVGVVTSSCRIRAAYSVPKGKYLLKKNSVKISGGKIDDSELEAIIRQQPNLSAAKIKLRLIAYNCVDSSYVEEKRQNRFLKIRKKNNKKRERETSINLRRENKARKKGNETYIYKTIQLKDTLNPRLTWAERVKYKFGEAPVIVDTFLYRKSVEQIHVYLHKKGYYFDTVTSYLDTIRNPKRQKIVAHYRIKTGPRMYIDSVYLVGKNSAVTGEYMRYIRKKPNDFEFNRPFYDFLNEDQRKPFLVPFDTDLLNNYRTKIAKNMRDNTLYGFSPTHITYTADTNQTTFRVKLGIEFTDRLVRVEGFEDSLVQIPHKITSVKAVYFHICDTNSFEGNFKATMKNELNLELKKDGFFQTIDTVLYAELLDKVEDKTAVKKRKGDIIYYPSSTKKNLFGQPKDSIAINPYRIATFTYNGEMFVQPGVLEAQNYLEYTNYYKEYYLDRTYNRLLQLGLFSVIKPEIIEVPGTDLIEVHYYLIPSKKQSFGAEPRGTNSNGYLGISASINYSSKNIFRTGWNTTFSLSGGLESNPAVFDESTNQKTSNRSLNTFEIGPTVKFDLPGLFPINVAKLDKRQRPRTVLSGAYNYQKRSDFDRGVFQLNYLWKFYVGKTQIFSVGLPTTSVIKFVALNKSVDFAQKIDAINDQFLRNAYSDQLIWEDLKLVYDYDNRDADEKKEKIRITFNATINLAGNFLYYAFRNNQAQDSVGHYKVFGVTYSQFSLLDTKLITYYQTSKNTTLAFRSLIGVGIPSKNTPTSLPYDYSFFAGGSNDNRGWDARTLGPGSYKYYVDSNRTATQIGDVRIGASLEYRFGTGGLFNHAFFVDLGNVWSYKNDINRPGGQFSSNFYRELGLAVGYGLRLDFDFLILRADFGFPLTNPALPQGERWVFQTKSQYNQELLGFYGTDYKNLVDNAFPTQLHIAIGFPF